MNRRLRRMQIIKHKRMLGLINPSNANMVRYKQKQATALLKSRSKGRFIPDDYLSVCFRKHSYQDSRTAYKILLSMLSFTRVFASAGASSTLLRTMATRAENPMVFMEFSAGGKDVGRIEFEVHSIKLAQSM